VSIVSNREPESLDNFEWGNGFCNDPKPQPPVTPRRPRPVTEPPRNQESQVTQLRDDVAASWHVEYFLRNVRAGRFLAGPYTSRQAAVEYATRLLEHDEYEHEVCRVTVLPLKGGVQ